MKIRDKIWCFFHGYCTKHAIKLTHQNWDGAAECARCDSEYSINSIRQDERDASRADKIRVENGI